MTDQLQVFANYLPSEKVIRLVHKLSFFGPARYEQRRPPNWAEFVTLMKNRQSVHLFQPQETNSVFETCFSANKLSIELVFNRFALQSGSNKIGE